MNLKNIFLVCDMKRKHHENLISSGQGITIMSEPLPIRENY